MDSREQKNCLGEIVQLTDSMFADAGNEDWDALTGKHSRRNGLIIVFFQETLALDVQFIAEKIEYILTLDKQIQALVKTYQQSLRKELQKISRGRNALKAYSYMK
jgi:Flagellar protein FliT